MVGVLAPRASEESGATAAAQLLGGRRLTTPRPAPRQLEGPLDSQRTLCFLASSFHLCMEGDLVLWCERELFIFWEKFLTLA